MPPPGVCLNILGDRDREEGKGSVDDPVKFFGQDYETLRQKCARSGRLYIDQNFLPDLSSIGDILNREEMRMVEWKRPSELVPNPRFFVEGPSRFDFRQGPRLGNCWFLAAIGAMTFQEDILKQVMPLGQEFDKDYIGIFHFRFWRFGKWVDVVIDDYLPMLDGRLIFVDNTTSNEFWAALLEKAYAKVCGSYADMHAGNISEALLDFSGGVDVAYTLQDAPMNLWDIMQAATTFVSIMGCESHQLAGGNNSVLPNGLVAGHAYSITGVCELRSQGRLVKLVRLWNPWCQIEWKGDWSDKSSLWQTVNLEDRVRCQKIEDNGEFWMCVEDFRQHFRTMDICCPTPNFLDGSKCSWESSYHEGRWITGTTAGGASWKESSYWTNPQYLIKLAPKEGPQFQGNNMVVTLMQKSDKKNRKLATNYFINFSIFKVFPEQQQQQQKYDGKFSGSFFKSSPLVKQSKLCNARSVTENFHLEEGSYIIVPSTEKPNQVSSFMLRILSKSEPYAVENTAQRDIYFPKANIRKTFSADNSILMYQDEAAFSETSDAGSSETMFQKYYDEFKEVDALQLQRLLNENVVKGVSTEGFGLDTCRSIIAMMDLSVTGRLNAVEFQRLWKRIGTFKNIFLRMSQTGLLSLYELRTAMQATGMTVSDKMLNLIALRYGNISGDLSLESFICVMLRLDTVIKTFDRLSDGKGMYLQEKEWLYLTIYS